jgi:hypothetical protein
VRAFEKVRKVVKTRLAAMEIPLSFRVSSAGSEKGARKMAVRLSILPIDINLLEFRADYEERPW